MTWTELLATFEDRELAALVVSLTCASFALYHRRVLASVPRWNVLLAAFLSRLLSEVITVVETLLPASWGVALDVSEHALGMLQSLLLLTWVSLLVWRRRKR